LEVHFKTMQDIVVIVKAEGSFIFHVKIVP